MFPVALGAASTDLQGWRRVSGGVQRRFGLWGRGEGVGGDGGRMVKLNTVVFSYMWSSVLVDLNPVTDQNTYLSNWWNLNTSLTLDLRRNYTINSTAGNTESEAAVTPFLLREDREVLWVSVTANNTLILFADPLSVQFISLSGMTMNVCCRGSDNGKQDSNAQEQGKWIKVLFQAHVRYTYERVLSYSVIQE